MSSKKKIFFISLLIIIAGVFSYFSTLYILNNIKIKNNTNNNQNDIETESKIEIIEKDPILKDLEIMEFESYVIEDFVQECENCILEYKYDEDSSHHEEGEYNITIIITQNNKEIEKEVKLIINKNELEENIETEANNQEENIKSNTNQSNQTNNNNQSNTNQNNKTNNKNENNQSNTNQSNNESNKNEDSKSSTNQSNDTNKDEESKIPEEPIIKKIETKTEEEVSTTYKYGTTINTITTITYDIYSDNTKKEVNRSVKTEYDYSTFNATTNDLKNEAKELVNSNQKVINDVIGYTNQYREEAGTISPLKYDYSLTLAANIRALEMAWSIKYSHIRPNNTDCFTIYRELGIVFFSAAENIAAGSANSKTISEAWKNSPGHYANMIDPTYTKIGVGYANVNGNNFWVQLFSD